MAKLMRARENSTIDCQSSIESPFTRYPHFFKDAILKCSPIGTICIVTFWSKKEDIYALIDECNLDKVLTIGNLYTSEGMKYIIKNSYLCKQIEYFVFVGSDRNNVAKTIGVTPLNTYGEQEFFNYFSSNRFVFCEKSQLNIVLANLPVEHINWISEYHFEEESTINIAEYDCENIGYIVRDSNLKRLWKRLLTKINLFGEIKPASNGNAQKECLGMVSVLTKPAIIDEEMPNYDLRDSYVPQVTESTLDANISYTYGSRLHECNQIESVVEKLKLSYGCRRAISVTWRVDKDTENVNPPCLVLTDFKVQKDKLFITCYFRSHDIYDAYCMNVYALQKLQEKVAARLNIECGYLMCVSNSAHVYSYNFDKIKDYNELDCNMDPRGYFIISINDKDITVKLMNSENKIIRTFTSSKVHTLMDQIQPFISEVSHALYLGKELKKARYCIKYKKEYLQK